MILKTAVAVALAATVSACAYDTYGNRSGNGGYGRSSRNNERAAFDTGFRDGLRQGRDDAREGDRFDPRGQREYRTADNGRWGSRYDDEYRDGFLSGYEQGFRDARGRGQGRGQGGGGRRRP